MDGSPDLKWRGARKMDNKKEAESVEVTPSEAVTERNSALPSFISYTSTDTKASQSYGSIFSFFTYYSVFESFEYNAA